MRNPFTWQEVEHWTGGDLLETLLLISDQDEADSFLSAYAEACEDDAHALHNIRYLAQLAATYTEGGKDEAQRMCDFFGLEVPGEKETISPQQWWKNSSLGVKTPA